MRAQRSLSLVSTLFVCAAGSTFAADPDRLNTREPALPPFVAPKPAGSGLQLPAVPQTAEETSATKRTGQRFLLERVAFVGNRSISDEDLQAVAAPLLGKTVSEADLETLRRDVTLLYLRRGYINSGAVLTPQSINGGTLTLQIVEGVLKEIRLRGLDGLDERYVADRLTRGHEPLNIQTLDQRFQLLLADPLFSRLNGQIVPDVERGKAILNVDVERTRPWQLSLTANNYRPVSIGAGQAILGGWVRNLTGHGDLVEGSYQGPLGNGKADRIALTWHMPLNTRGTQLTLGYDDGSSSVIEQVLQPLDIESHLTSKDIGISQVCVETLRDKFSIGLNRLERENRTTLLGMPFSFTPGEPSGTSRATDWRFWQEYAHRQENQVLALRSNFTFGRNNQVDGGLTSGAMPDRHYRIWLGQLQYARRLPLFLGDDTQFIGRFNLQHTPDRLIAMEGMSVGGVHTVRGYRENLAVRDKGAVANLELNVPVITDGARQFRLNLIPFYDHGRAQNVGEAAVRLSSVGLAARMVWHALTLDLAAAKRHSHTLPTGGGSTLQDRGIHAQAAWAFF